MSGHLITSLSELICVSYVKLIKITFTFFPLYRGLEFAQFLLLHALIILLNYCFSFVSAMSELLFECYNVPSVAYGIDSLFSLYHNFPVTGQ